MRDAPQASVTSGYMHPLNAPSEYVSAVWSWPDTP